MSNRYQNLEAPQVPNLPVPDPGYSKFTADQHNSLLRNFMLKLVSSLRSLFGPNGGQYVDCPNGLFFNTVDQTFAATNTAYPVLFPTTYLSNAVKVNAGTESRIYVDIAGVYNFQYSGQLVSTSSSAKDVYIWIRRNGTNIGYSTHIYTLAGNNEHFEISWNFNIDMQVGDYLELEVAASSTDIRLEAIAPTAPHPGVPSSVIAVSFIAPLPTVLPTPP
jgi:hypothetical protein